MRRRSTLLLAVIAASLALSAGCGKHDAPEELDDPDVQGDTTAPDGTPYPTTNIGSRAHAGTIPGNDIANLAFHGYKASDLGAGLQLVSMADYFDPKAVDHKVLHLMAAATWCTVCDWEAGIMVQNAPQLRKEGAIEVAIMVAGQTPQYGPSLTELDAWVTQNKTTFDVLVDVRGHRLWAAMGPMGVPWNALIDTRTMEILDSESGAPNDEAAYVRLGLSYVARHPL